MDMVYFFLLYHCLAYCGDWRYGLDTEADGGSGGSGGPMRGGKKKALKVEKLDRLGGKRETDGLLFQAGPDDEGPRVVRRRAGWRIDRQTDGPSNAVTARRALFCSATTPPAT